MGVCQGVVIHHPGTQIVFRLFLGWVCGRVAVSGFAAERLLVAVSGLGAGVAVGRCFWFWRNPSVTTYSCQSFGYNINAQASANIINAKAFLWENRAPET